MKLLNLRCSEPSLIGQYIEEFNKLASSCGLLAREDFAICSFIQGLPEPLYTIAYNEVNISGVTELTKIRRLVEQHSSGFPQ